ncbi:MAG: hypothetical protein HZA50_14725 [Planctomycetes bacterium]|nr:hypothetical protein [Planctomycetota bacterium]
MNSVTVDIAEAVVSELNAGAFSQAFTAVREWLPRFDLAELKDLHVTVVPKVVSEQPAGRKVCQYEYSVDVGIQKKLTINNGAEKAEIDSLIVLVEEIAGFFRQRRLSAYPDAAWVKTEYSHLYVVEHLSQLGQFTSVLTLTFRVFRETA